MYQLKRDPSLFSTPHLLWLGTQSLRWNQDAQEILSKRGEASIMLRQYETVLKNADRTYNIDFMKDIPRPEPDKPHKCVDCGKKTFRTYNNGTIHQCEQCALDIQRAGSRSELERRKAVLKAKKAEDLSTKTGESSEVIPAGEPSYETLLTEGVHPDAIKAAGNAELAQVAAKAYQEAKTNSPLAKAIQEVKRAA